jgi:hypothetical protein
MGTLTPHDVKGLGTLPRKELEAQLQAAILQRDDALRQLNSRANIQQTIEQIDQLRLSMESMVTGMQRHLNLLHNTYMAVFAAEADQPDLTKVLTKLIEESAAYLHRKGEEG